MTLYQWCERAGIDLRIHKSGAAWVPDTFTNPANRSELWHLSDWAVSSVSGGTIWLLPRTGHNPPRAMAKRPA